MVIRAFCFIFLIGIFTIGACFADEKIVRVATLEDYAPFCMLTNEQIGSKQTIPPGNDAVGFKGYCWDVLRESFHDRGYTIQLTVTPWARAMLNVKKGDADILFPTGKNSNRIKIFDYSQEPTNHANFLIYIKTDRQIKWNGLEGLEGLTIGVKRGFNYGDRWKAAIGITKYSIKTISQGFKMLSANRIDGFLGYEYNWDYYIKQTNLTGQFKKLPAFDSSSEYLVALKSNPSGKKFLNAFDLGKKHLMETGRLNAIKMKWFGIH